MKLISKSFVIAIVSFAFAAQSHAYFSERFDSFNAAVRAVPAGKHNVLYYPCKTGENQAMCAAGQGYTYNKACTFFNNLPSHGSPYCGGCYFGYEEEATAPIVDDTVQENTQQDTTQSSCDWLTPTANIVTALLEAAPSVIQCLGNQGGGGYGYVQPQPMCFKPRHHDHDSNRSAPTASTVNVNVSNNNTNINTVGGGNKGGGHHKPTPPIHTQPVPSPTPCVAVKQPGEYAPGDTTTQPSAEKRRLNEAIAAANKSNPATKGKTGAAKVAVSRPANEAPKNGNKKQGIAEQIRQQASKANASRPGNNKPGQTASVRQNGNKNKAGQGQSGHRPTSGKTAAVHTQVPSHANKAGGQHQRVNLVKNVARNNGGRNLNPTPKLRTVQRQQPKMQTMKFSAPKMQQRPRVNNNFHPQRSGGSGGGKRHGK